MPEYPQHIIDRFWSYVDKTPTPEGHWLWIGGKDYDGYGIFSFPTGLKKPRQTHKKAHRFAYELFYGYIPDGLQILHKPPCFTTSCVVHIYAGTPKQNAADAFLMNHRNPKKGEEHHNAKLTSSTVVAMRLDHNNGLTIKEVAIKYSHNYVTTLDVLRRESWKHIN